MYNRKAKGITADVWNGLMRDITISEIRDTIAKMDGNKAPGYDGTSIDLIKMLTLSEERAILETLTDLVNAAIRKGESRGDHIHDSEEKAGRVVHLEG